MKTGRILIAGAAVTVFNLVAGRALGGGVFNWVYKLEPTQIWRATGGGPGAKFIISSFVLSVALAFVYALIQKGIPGKNKLVKGIVFGLCVWAAGRLPGLFFAYSFMAISPVVVVYWAILGLIQMPLKGMIIAAIYGE